MMQIAVIDKSSLLTLLTNHHHVLMSEESFNTFRVVDGKLYDDKEAHIVGLDELVQRLIPGGVVEVELASSHWEPFSVSWLVYPFEVSQPKPSLYLPILYIYKACECMKTRKASQ